MKTNKEKLIILLQKAVENGFYKSYCIDQYNNNVSIKSVSKKWLMIEYETNEWESLNDIVTNFEPDEVSFTEALCLETIKDIKFEGASESYLDVKRTSKKLIKEWSWDCDLDDIRPTSQRLDWLFETFKHLLSN